MSLNERADLSAGPVAASSHLTIAEPTPRPTQRPTARPTPRPTPEPTFRATPEPTPTVEPTPELTLAQRNAISKAREYLDYT